jgi:MFS family permease
MEPESQSKSIQARDEFRRLSILIAVATLDLTGAAMIFPLMPLYAKALKIPPFHIGVITASFYVAQLISAPLWGRVSDRYGRRPALLVGLAALGSGYLIFGFAHSMWMLVLARVIQGAGGGTTGVTQAYVADTVRPESRTRSLGWLSAGTNIGTMMGPVLGSWAAAYGQLAPGALAASLCVLNLTFAFMWLPESLKPGQAVRKRKPVWRNAWHVIRHPGGDAQRLTLIYAVGMFGQTCMSAVLALFLSAKFGITVLTIGSIFFYQNVFSVIMRSALLGPIVDRISELWSMRIGAMFLIVGLAGYPLAPNLWVLAAIIPLIPIGTAMLFPATTALLSKATDAADYGTALGVAQTFAGISRLVAPLMATALFGYLSPNLPFFVAAEIAALGCLLTFRIQSPRLKPAPVAAMVDF